MPGIADQVALDDYLAAVGGGDTLGGLARAYAFPVGELLGRMVDLGEQPLAVIAGRGLVCLYVLLPGLLSGVQRAGVTIVSTFEAAQLGSQLLDPARDSDRGITVVGGLGGGIGAAARGGSGPLRLHSSTQCVPGLLDRAAMARLAAVADLDRLTGFG